MYWDPEPVIKYIRLFTEWNYSSKKTEKTVGMNNNGTVFANVEISPETRDFDDHNQTCVDVNDIVSTDKVSALEADDLNSEADQLNVRMADGIL